MASTINRPTLSRSSHQSTIRTYPLLERPAETTVRLVALKLTLKLAPCLPCARLTCLIVWGGKIDRVGRGRTEGSLWIEGACE